MNIYGGYPHNWWEPSKEARTVRYIVIYRRPDCEGLRSDTVDAPTAQMAVNKVAGRYAALHAFPVAVGDPGDELHAVQQPVPTPQYLVTSRPFNG